MKVFGLQGEIMRSVRLADKTFDDSGAVFCLRRLERFDGLRKVHGLTAGQAAEVALSSIPCAPPKRSRRNGGVERANVPVTRCR